MKVEYSGNLYTSIKYFLVGLVDDAHPRRAYGHRLPTCGTIALMDAVLTVV